MLLSPSELNTMFRLGLDHLELPDELYIDIMERHSAPHFFEHLASEFLWSGAEPENFFKEFFRLLETKLKQQPRDDKFLHHFNIRGLLYEAALLRFTQNEGLKSARIRLCPQHGSDYAAPFFYSCSKEGERKVIAAYEKFQANRQQNGEADLRLNDFIFSHFKLTTEGCQQLSLELNSGL